MNKIRLTFQNALGLVAIPLGFNHRLRQFCNRCGRTRYLPFWVGNEVWEAVAENVNGCHHGAYCVRCFDILARNKGVYLDWTAKIGQA